MKYVGLISSGEPDADGVFRSVEHIPFNKSEKEIIIPHGSEGTSGWLSGFIQNLSPTFPLFILFYNAGKEAQQIVIPSLHEIKFKNQNCERLIIMTKMNENNATQYGVFRYTFDIIISTSHEESSELLVYADYFLKSLDPNIIYNGIVLHEIQNIIVGTPFDIFIPKNRQLIVLSLHYDTLTDTLPSGQIANDHIIMDALYTTSPPQLIDRTVLNSSQYKQFVELKSFVSDAVGINDVITNNESLRINSSTTLASNPTIAITVEYVVI